MSETLMSYVCGTSDEPLLYRTVGAALEEAAARWPDRDALIVPYQGIRWSYRQLNDAADRLAAGLVHLGFVPGDRLGIWSPNCYEWVLTQFASAKAGLILVSINPAYRRNELEFALSKVGCKGLVLASTFRSSDYLAILQGIAPEIPLQQATDLHLERLPALRCLILTDVKPMPGFLSMSDVELLGTSSDRARLAGLHSLLQPEDPINIQFTSGTTGLPKGATLSHHNIVNNGFFVARRMRFSHNERLCIPVPLYHCFGMVMGVLGCVTHGAAMVFPAAGFEPRRVLEAVTTEKCTALYGVPTMFIAELEDPEFRRYDLSSLRTGIMAGAPCPVELMKRVINQMHLREITICYGMTETSPVSFQSACDDTIERRVSTVGTIHPHLEVKIVDAAGKTVPRGERGEILTRGYSVMQGYWDDPQKSREVIDERGWMHTGDLGTLDEHGYCNIVGRVKDLIIRGGENISPREIEEFLYRHPKLLDVQVFGVPDPRYGEVVCAWIKLKPNECCDAEAVRCFCAERIAHYKIPQYIRFVSEFPMTVTGKVQKYVMREQMIRELNLDSEKTA
jgi:fatty-acyl-CoA synthase